ncbi:MAG TPA: peptide ABC transporter substrate-binding protein [Gemmatimonadales bacterium]|nr:peptide ABC transporter substrate-binding protein [Gemmatimonadales bacterium]
MTARRYAIGSLALLWTATAAACGRPDRQCEGCETLVVAAVSEPSTLLPPLVGETVGRDIGDQVFERLADLRPGAASIDSAAYLPALAARWERVDSLTWRFHLRPGARWHDGRPVTSGDVRFSFEAFSDSTIGSPAQSVLAGRVAIVPEDSATFLVRFTEPSPEQLYDATYHVRVIPAHVWSAIPKDGWAADTALGHLVGSGPYRVAQWQRGQFLTLAADTSFAPAPALRRAIWRFTSDPDAALNLVLSHEADVLEAAAGPDRERRAEADSSVRIIRYPSAAYGFLGFNLTSPKGHAGSHPVLGDRATRRALAMAIDRATAAKAVFGPSAKAPPGPMSQLLWLWSDSIAILPFDPAAAARELDAEGWRKGPDGVRARHGRRLGFDILVPTTSAARRQLATLLQEMWRSAGAAVTVTSVDFPVFQERLGQGRFDAYIGAWLDEPSPRGLADQWTRQGWAALNYGHYANPRFDSLFARASHTARVAEAGHAYRTAMDTLNADAPALFLFAPANAAVVSARVRGLEINPYSWASGLRNWRVE